MTLFKGLTNVKHSQNCFDSIFTLFDFSHSPEMVRTNIETITMPLTDAEHDLLRTLMERYFANLPESNWENVEVKRYHEDPDSFVKHAYQTWQKHLF